MLTQARNTVENLAVVGIAGGIIVVGFLGVRCYMDWENCFLNPNRIVTRTYENTDFLIQENIEPVIDKATGGVVDVDWKTFGTTSTNQAKYDAAKKIHDNKGAAVGIVAATVAGGVLTAGIAPALTAAVAGGVSVVKGVDKLVRSGPDRAVSKIALRVKNPKRDALLKDQEEKRIKAITSHKFNFKPTFITDPMPYMTDTQLHQIDGMTETILHHHHDTPLSSSQLKRMGNAMKIWHGLKMCQMEGLFLNETDKAVTNMKPLTFFNCMQKIENPHAVVFISKKKVDKVRKFIRSRSL